MDSDEGVANADSDMLGGWTSQVLDKHWVALYRFVMQDGRPVLAEAHIYPRTQPMSLDITGWDGGERPRHYLPAPDAPPEDHWRAFLRRVHGYAGGVPRGGISSRLLRRMRPYIALADQLSNPREVILLRLRAHPDWEALSQRLMPVFDEDRPAETRPQARLRRLAHVAQLYAVGLADGRTRLNVDIANVTGRSVSKIRDDIYAARREGLLTQGARRGRPAGVLTEKALAILAAAEEG